MNNSQVKNKMIVMAGPSGAGKTTLCRHIQQIFPVLTFSVSATTRLARKGETDGKDYYFLSQSDFEEKMKQEEFLEYEEVFKGRFYGTLKTELKRIWNENKIPLLDVDVNGALRIKKTDTGKTAKFIFVYPGSREILKERLLKRGTESLEAIEERLNRSDKELENVNEFDFVLKNDDLQRAQMELVEEIRNYLRVQTW